MRHLRPVSEWTWRHALLGLALVLDGLILTVTLGFVSSTFRVRVGLWVTRYRL